MEARPSADRMANPWTGERLFAAMHEPVVAIAHVAVVGPACVRACASAAPACCEMNRKRR